MFLYYRCTNDVVIVHKMAAPGDVRMRLRTHIQRAIVAACELEVTYKCSMQILGIVCVSIDGDEDNELVVKIQKKCCKGSSLQVLREGSVGSGGNAVLASCDSQRMPRCCEPTVNGASDKIDCDTPELTDSFPRSFRPIPFSETLSQRNPLASVSGVKQGGGDCPKSYPLCPYDLPCDSHEMFQQRPGTVPLDSKAMNTCADVPVVCDVRPLRRVCNYKPISPPHLGDASLATSTDIRAQHFTGFTQLCGDAIQCDATLQKRLLFAPNDGQPPGGSGHRSALSRKLFALTSFTDATLRGTSRGGRNGMGKVRKRTPVGGRWIKLPERPGQRTMAQCFGITKNKRLTYSAEEQVELEHGGFARTMQRLLCRPPLRALTKDGFESDVNGPTYQTAGSVNDIGPVDISNITGGDSVMENVQDINKVSLNRELNLLVEHCHPTTTHGKLISGDCDTICDNVNEHVDNVTSAAPPRDPLCSSTPMVGASTISGTQHVTCVNNVSEYCAAADPAKTEKTSEFQDGLPCKKTTGTSDHVLVGSASEVIRDKHSGNVSNTNNTVSSEAKAACSVSGRRVMSVAKKVDFGVVNDDHHVMSMSDSSSDTEESVKGHETKCDVATTAVPVTGYSQEPNMSSDICMDSSVNLCEQRNVGVTETASGHVGPASTASQCGGCTTTSELANNYTLRKTAKCCTVTDTKGVMSTSGGTTNGIACTSEEQTVEACQTKGEVSSEIRQLVPVREGDNVYTESVHHKLKVDDSAACLGDTDDDESIIVCSHATNEGNPAEVCKNIVTSVGALMTDCCKNACMVDVIPERALCGKKHVISNEQCPDPSVDSCAVSVSNVALDTQMSAGGSCPRKRDTHATSAMSHEHNLTPGKHVRNLFPESIACKDVAGRRETYCLATNGLFFSPNLPAVETPDSHAGSLSGKEKVTKLGHVDASSMVTETEFQLEAVNESQIASVPCEVASVEMSATGEDSSNTRLSQPDEDGLVQRPSGHEEHSPQRCGVEVTRLVRSNTLFHSVSGSAGVNGAFHVSPLIRPPIRVRNDGSSRIPDDESRVCSLLMTAPASATEHGALPDQASVHQPDGLLMRERQVHSELGRFVLKDLTSPDRDVVHLGYTLSGGQTKTRSADPDCCNSDVTGAAVPTQKEVGSAAFHMRDDDIGVSQLETVLCRPTDSLDTSPTVPHQHTSSGDTTETLLHVTNMYSASGVTCPDVARDRVNVTGSWTVVTDPLVTFPTSSVAAASRPLVTVTSFRNIHFSNVMFGSTEGKIVVSEAGLSPCAVKENRGDGLLQKLRRPLTPKTRDERWKWPASLLRTISRRSRAVSRRRLKTKSETVYSVDKVKGKGRWSRRWRPGADSL